MDLATLVGLLLAVGMIAGSVTMSGGDLGMFWHSASFLTVVGGTLAALLICYPLKLVLRAPQLLLKSLFHTTTNLTALIAQIVELADVARREGLLALDQRLPQIEAPFLRQGIELAVDGVRPDVIADLLKTEVETMALRHKEGKQLIEQLAKFAPAFGMIGTLLGLIMMLGKMSDPASIGGGMAVALVTTLYGVLLANGSLLPMAEKLSYLSKQEMLSRELIIRGVLAIQAGEHPRLIAQRLSTFLPSADRPNMPLRSNAA